MKKQKICIIGGSLTGLVTAISLSKLNCQIDLITGNVTQNLKSNKTIAISENNFDFLNTLDISKSLKKEMWACSIMKLYTESKNKRFSEVFEINNESKNKKILYMVENYKIIKLMMNKIKKIKSISLKSNQKVSSISDSGMLKNVKFKNNTSTYSLIIICTGNNSNLIKNYFNEEVIENSYNESAITTILNHSPIKNNIVRQIFLEKEIVALLPISNKKTSIVWSARNDIQKKDKFYIKKKIKIYAQNYLKKIKFKNKIEHKNLNFLVRNKYYLNRVLLFGDALHVMHPFIGQGFNMTLRDLACLKKILNKKIDLGLDIGSLDILSEFSNTAKPRNFIFSIGSEILKNSLSFKKVRNNILKIMNKNNFLKETLFNIADKGFRF